MEELDKLTVQQKSPARQSLSQQLRPWLARHWDLLAVVLLVLASFPVEWLSPRMLVLVGPSNDIADWLLDTSFKASRGLWFGRDLTFTYGPLFQWLSSAPARWMGLSMGAIYVTCTTLPLWCTFLFGYLTLNLLLPEQAPWKRFLLLLLLCLFWAPWEGRSAFAIFLFALFLRGWYASRKQELRPVQLGSAAALLCALAFLYSTDTGAYAIAALLISLAGVAWESRREPLALRSYASTLAVLVVVSLVIVIAMNAVMARPFDFRFWRNSVAILSGYRWIEPTSMSRVAAVRLLVVLLVAGAVFLVRGMTARNRSPSITAHSGFLLSAFVFAVFTMQAALVRPDWEHIIVSTYAPIFLTGVVLFSFASRTASAFTVLFAVACFLFSGPGPGPLVQWVVRVHHNYLQLRSPLTRCPPNFQEFDRACYVEGRTRVLKSAASYLQERSGPGDYMTVFSYETIFGIASRRTAAGGVMESYLASGEYLSRVDIAGLERAAAPAGLYILDGKYAGAIDNVSSFTRSPEVWLWMFRHYRSERQVFSGIFGLQRDDSRAAHITMQLQPLNIALRSYPIHARSSQVDLGNPVWPGDRADFLRLRLNVHYSPWWKLRKPALLLLEIEHPDAIYDQKAFLVEPNVSSEVWFYPGDEAELAQYFDSDEKRWRLGPRTPITGLRLLVMPFDWVSVQPDAIEVQAADAVSFGMTP